MGNATKNTQNEVVECDAVVKIAAVIPKVKHAVIIIYRVKSTFEIWFLKKYITIKRRKTHKYEDHADFKSGMNWDITSKAADMQLPNSAKRPSCILFSLLISFL